MSQSPISPEESGSIAQWVNRQRHAVIRRANNGVMILFLELFLVNESRKAWKREFLYNALRRKSTHFLLLHCTFRHNSQLSFKWEKRFKVSEMLQVDYSTYEAMWLTLMELYFSLNCFGLRANIWGVVDSVWAILTLHYVSTLRL